MVVILEVLSRCNIPYMDCDVASRIGLQFGGDLSYNRGSSIVHEIYK